MATTKKMTKTTTSDETIETKVVKKTDEVKEYAPEDLIPCRSMTSGGLYIKGERSGFMYTWADCNDVIDVEYRDLVYMIRSNDKSIYEPRIIIEDDNIVSQYKQLVTLYNSLYSNTDLSSILNLPASQMATAVNNLPSGAKEALKGMVATMIDNKTLDSVSKIKVLDEIFGTKLLLALAES